MTKRRQSKSGSSKRRRPALVVHHRSGARTIYAPIDEEMQGLLRQQKEAFVAKFGREPRPGDPLLFDPKEAEPKFMSQERQDEVHQQMLQAMEQAGVRPELIHAYRRSGVLLTGDNEHLMAPGDAALFRAAVDEYFEFKALGDKAEGKGVHPAIVLALRRTGLLLPTPGVDWELEDDGRVVGDNELVLDWIEAVNEWMVAHPDAPAPDFSAVPSLD